MHGQSQNEMFSVFWLIITYNEKQTGLSKMECIPSSNILRFLFMEKVAGSLKDCVSGAFSNHSLPVDQCFLKIQVLHDFYSAGTDTHQQTEKP